MVSGPSHSQELLPVELRVGQLVADVVVVVGAAVVAGVAVAVDAAVAVAGPGPLLLADGMPDRCSSTTGCIVLQSSFDFRILDIDSYYHLYI